MKILGNSSRDLILLQKRWLYKCCALLIALYNFQLWYYNKAPLNYSLKVLRKMQWRVTLWISGAFHTLPTADIEAISSLIPIHLHLKKLYSRFHLRGFSLLSNHIIKSIINTDRPNDHTKHCLSLNSLISKQISCLSSPLINMDNRCNEFLLSFFPFNREFSPGNRLIDTFPDRFSLNPQTYNVKNHLCKLDDITIQASSDPSSCVIISDTSIKNYIVISFSHIHLFNRPIIKMCHYAANISTTEIELFTMKYSINQAIGISHIKCYNLSLIEWKPRTTLVLEYTKELDRVSSTSWSILYTFLSWSMLSYF